MSSLVNAVMLISTIKQAEAICGTLSNPSKMPGFGYGLPASLCNVGARLAKIAGSVCSKCYALKGNYLYTNVQKSLTFRAESIMHPLWVDAMVFLILKKTEKIGCNEFRWHDSGDLQSLLHLEQIVEVCYLTPNIIHWLPTREVALIRQYLRTYGPFPANLCVRVSSPMVDDEPISGFPNTSTVVSKSAAGNYKGFICPAPKQGNKCGDCRACWNKKVPNVAYMQH